MRRGKKELPTNREAIEKNITRICKGNEINENNLIFINMYKTQRQKELEDKLNGWKLFKIRAEEKVDQSNTQIEKFNLLIQQEKDKVVSMQLGNKKI